MPKEYILILSLPNDPDTAISIAFTTDNVLPHRQHKVVEADNYDDIEEYDGE